MNLRRSSILRTVASGAALAILASCGSSDKLEADPTSPQSVESSAEQVSGDGYTYAVPAGWDHIVEDTLPTGVDTLVRAPEPVEDFLTNINIVVSPAPGVDELDLSSPDLEQVRQELASSAQSETTVLPEPIADTDIDGYPAIGHQVESFEVEGRTLTLTQYLAVRDEVSYVVTVTASASDAGTADAAVQSVLDSWTWQ